MEQLPKAIPPKVDEVFRCLYNARRDDNYVLNAIVIGQEYPNNDKCNCYFYYLPIVTAETQQAFFNSLRRKPDGIAQRILIDYLQRQGHYARGRSARFMSKIITTIPGYQDMTEINDIPISEIAIIITMFENVYKMNLAEETNEGTSHTTFQEDISNYYERAFCIISGDYHVTLSYSQKLFNCQTGVESVPTEIWKNLETAFGNFGYKRAHNPGIGEWDLGYYSSPYTDYFKPNQELNIIPNNQAYYDKFYDEYGEYYGCGNKKRVFKHPSEVYPKKG